jgi:hypothetical protein
MGRMRSVRFWAKSRGLLPTDFVEKLRIGSKRRCEWCRLEKILLSTFPEYTAVTELHGPRELNLLRSTTFDDTRSAVSGFFNEIHPSRTFRIGAEHQISTAISRLPYHSFISSAFHHLQNALLTASNSI